MDALRVSHLQEKSWRTFFMEIAVASVPLMIAGVIINRLLNAVDDTAKQKADKKNIHDRVKKHTKRRIPPTNSYEDLIMQDMIFPDQINVSFDDIGGLQHLKEQILETVILPLQNPELFAAVNQDNTKSQRLITIPKGVLFYGPPGTGKTMMAKAIAKSCQATFINLQLSTLQNKWFGESQKLVRALFSLAHKFAPTIIFIDEIDLFLKERSGQGDHEATSAMKAEFMSLWDGLVTDESVPITILGATNRPFDVDKAILRRLPRTFLFDLPNLEERKAVIDVILANHKKERNFDAMELAKRTDKYCGSDLKELCKYAAMRPIREAIREHIGHQKSPTELLHVKIPITMQPRPLSLEDCYKAMDYVKPTGATSYEYQAKFQEATRREGREGRGREDLAEFLAAFQNAL